MTGRVPWMCATPTIGHETDRELILYSTIRAVWITSIDLALARAITAEPDMRVRKQIPVIHGERVSGLPGVLVAAAQFPSAAAVVPRVSSGNGIAILCQDGRGRALR